MNSSNIAGHHRTPTTLTTSAAIVIILFIRSTAVLYKYLNDELKLCLLQFFPEVAKNSLSFPCSEKSPSIPGLWPPSVCKSIQPIARLDAIIPTRFTPCTLHVSTFPAGSSYEAVAPAAAPLQLCPLRASPRSLCGREGNRGHVIAMTCKRYRLNAAVKQKQTK